MSTVLQFWASDGPNGEQLIKEYRCKVLTALTDAALNRPARTVLVILHDTRPYNKGGRDIDLWRKPGYTSATGSGPGILNTWQQHI